MNQPPDGIVITISRGMIKEKGYRNWLRNFLFAMDQHDQGWTYWMRLGARPKQDKHLSYVYLCIGGKVRFRAFYAGSEGPSEKTFSDGKMLAARAWIRMAGPVERPHADIPMAGFRGFKYIDKLF